MNANELLNKVIIPTLQSLQLDSEIARYLLLGTAAQESNMGRYKVQSYGGPALGIYQMELATHNDIWNNYLRFRPELADKVTRLLKPGLSKESQLVSNLSYASAMARLQYLRVSEPLPELSIIQLARYWKKHYNTHKGKGKVRDFEKNFNQFVGEVDVNYSCQINSNGSRLVRGKATVTKS